MRTVEIQFQGNNRRSPDRWTQVLVWMAVVLLAAVVAVGADLWIWPGTGDWFAQALDVMGIGPSSPLIAGTTALLLPAPTSPAETPTVAAPPTDPLPVSQPAPPTIPAASPPTLVPLISATGTSTATPTTLAEPTTAPQPSATATVVPSATPVLGSALPLSATLVLDSALPLSATTALESASPVPPADASESGAWPTLVPTNTVLLSETALLAENPAVVLPSPASTDAPKSAFQVKIPNRYLNIVLLGSDKRPSSQAWRTDSMIVVSVDVENNVIRVLSIPRDLWVYIPRHGFNRVNTAELWGELAKKGSGTERVKQTIYHNLGIPIHYYVRVDFQGFIKIIDTVGGVDIDVDCPLPDIKLSAGMHHMDGKQALQYARSRKSTSDIDRGRRQRKVLMSLWEKALSLDMLRKVPELWVTMADSFQTDLPLDQVLNLAYVGAQLRPQHILSTAINYKQVRGWRTPSGAAVLVPREDKLRAFLEEFYVPVEPAQLNVPEKVRVEVLNGAQRLEAEQLAAAELRRAGFKVVGADQAERQDYVQTEIHVLNGDTNAGERIAQKLKVPATALRNLTGIEQPNPADIRVLLGQDYDPCQR